LCDATDKGKSYFTTESTLLFPDLINYYENDYIVLFRLCQLFDLLIRKHQNHNMVIYAVENYSSRFIDCFDTLINCNDSKVYGAALSLFLFLSCSKQFVNQILKTSALERFCNYFRDHYDSLLAQMFCKAVDNINFNGNGGRRIIFSSKSVISVIVNFTKQGNSKLYTASVTTLGRLCRQKKKMDKHGEIKRLVNEGCIEVFCDAILLNTFWAPVNFAVNGLAWILCQSDFNSTYASEIENNRNALNRIFELSKKAEGLIASDIKIVLSYFPENLANDEIEELIPVIDDEKCELVFNQELTLNHVVNL